MSNSISVVIPNFNGKEILEKNLPKVFSSLSLYKQGVTEVIVSDDCSTDDSMNALKALQKRFNLSYPRIKLRITGNNRNLGFAYTVNSGVKSALGDILILLNTDVYPKNDFLTPLIKHFADPEVFAVGCEDESIENGKTVLRGRGVGAWKKGFLIHSRGEVNKTNTLWVNGGSGAFRKSIWEKLGGMDTMYSPFYWEDIDLSYRALKSGYKIVFEPKSLVVHEHEKGAIKNCYSDFAVKTIAYRNQFLFVWKNATDLNLQFLHALWLPYHFAGALLRLDFNFFAGFFSALLLLPRATITGFKIQKYFTKSDQEIIRSLA